MRVHELILLAAAGTQAERKKNSKKKLKPVKISSRNDPNGPKILTCRFWENQLTSKYGTLSVKEPMPYQCWPINTQCEHGLEVKFTAKNQQDLCDISTPKFGVWLHYENQAAPTEINLCSQKPSDDYEAPGDWIYLNGTSNALIEYESPSFDSQYPWKVDWQCFTTESQAWRRAIGKGWENIIGEWPDMQERFKIKLHKIITKLMIQVTMKDKCLSEPSNRTLKRIENAEEIDSYIKAMITLIRQRFATCKVPNKQDREILDAKTIRHLEFKQSQAKNLQNKARTVIEKFEKFQDAPTQSFIDARFMRRLRRGKIPGASKQ